MRTPMLGLLAIAAVALAGCQQIVEPSLVVVVTAPQRGVAGPLEGVQVLLSDDIHGGTTDEDGRVPMFGVGPGSYNVTVRWREQTAVRSVMVGGATASLHIELNETVEPAIRVQVWTQNTTAACPACGIQAPRPAAGAVVLLSDNVHGGRTDAEGAFAFFDLERGAYNVTVAWRGAEEVRRAAVGVEPVDLQFTFAQR